MKQRICLVAALAALLWATPAMADNRIIVRTTLGLQGLQQICLLQNCTVLSTTVDGTLGQVFLLTTPLDPTAFLPILRALPGIVHAELDQVLNLTVGLNTVTTAPAALTDTTPVTYFGTTVWNGYANQPASTIIHIQSAQSTFHISGTGIVADVDTGVDPNHPALKSVLLPGYDFTRNQAGASEMSDLSPSFSQPAPCANCKPAVVNQSTAAVLDQSTAAVLDGNLQYAAFGHGTMVMGVIHLVAPKAQLLPLKAFRSDGTGNLSDILRAIYYGVQNNANVINMSFDFKTSSQELTNALNYASQLNVICAASAGNDGQGPPTLVYPAALQSDVIGVASTSDLDTRSTFSNYGNVIVWVAAPGEAIVTTYPFGTYSAGWGTSFSAPFVSGTAALMRNVRTDMNQSLAAGAVAHAQFVGANLGNGRLDLLMALAALPTGRTSPEFSVAAAPSTATITAGEETNFTVSAAPVGGFSQTVNWTCDGAPVRATCTVSPSSMTLDGVNAGNATVRLTTERRVSSMLPLLPQSAPRVQFWQILTACFAWFLTVAMLWNFSRVVQRRLWFGAALLLMASAFCVSCGTGYQAPPGPPPNQGTPAGTYLLTLTASFGNLNHATTIKVTVN
jgi:subtilisin family serine protease